MNQLTKTTDKNEKLVLSKQADEQAAKIDDKTVPTPFDGSNEILLQKHQAENTLN